jgi:hypothetical protein
MFLGQCTYTANCVSFSIWHMCLQTFVRRALDIFEIEHENGINESVMM